MLLLQQRPGPVHVTAVQPVVVDAQCVLQVTYSMVPTTGHKDGFASFLQQHERVVNEGRPVVLLGLTKSIEDSWC